MNGDELILLLNDRKEREKEWIHRDRFRKHEAVREHEHRIVAVGSLDL